MPSSPLRRRVVVTMLLMLSLPGLVFFAYIGFRIFKPVPDVAGKYSDMLADFVAFALFLLAGVAIAWFRWKLSRRSEVPPHE